jgi:hypothetical protein
MRLLALFVCLSAAAFAQSQQVGPCNQSAAFNLSASGTTQIIAAAGSNEPNKIIRVCKIDLSTNGTAVNFKIVATNGSDTALTGVYQNVITYSQDWQGQLSNAVVGAGSIGINLNTTAATGGTVTFFRSAN